MVAFVEGSDGEVIAPSEMHDLHTKIHNILDSTMSKWVGDMDQMLAYLFNAASRQHHEVWVSQFFFLHSIKDYIPPSKACLYGNFNWLWAQGSPTILT